MRQNTWAKLGSATLLLGGIGHFIIVDLMVTILQASHLQTVPSDLIHQLAETEINWGYLGKSDALHMLSGFSLWSVAGCVVVGIYNWIIFSGLPPGHKIRRYSLWLCLSFSGVFLVLAVTSFIYPAMLGGGIALFFFLLAYNRERKIAL